MDSTKMASRSSFSAFSPPCVNSRIRMARGLIKFSVLAVGVCYLLSWVASPTKVFANSWRPVINSKINTVYFGFQGLPILMYMAPIYVVAVLGCVYLYFCERLNLSRSQQQVKREVENEISSSWKRPCFVKSRLGIVSRTELAFLAMFILLLIWTFMNYIHRGLDTITSVNPNDEKRSLVILDWVAVWLGLVGNICLAFMFFPVTRASSILPLFGLTFESSVRYHIWLGHIAMVLFTAHGAFYVLYWGLSGDLMQILKWDKHGISNLAGEISLVAGILMWVTTFPKIRQNMFELFFYTHYLYIVFVVFFALHLGAYFTCMTLPGFYLFVIDRYLRLLQSQQNVKLISARVLPCESVELNFAKSPGLKYPPTSCMFVKVPCVSSLQWHPFTVCSNSDLEEDIISVLIKSEGSWTRKLNQMLSAHPSIEHLQVSVEGPYGPESADFFRHNTLVMVSGGSGIAPFISIIRGLIHAASNARNTPKAILISAFKSSSELEMLDLLLPLSARSPSALSNLDIQIEAYVTREHEHSKSSKAISTIWFKPHHLDAPISATLGPNSWLWLAMIISSSFAISLLLIGFATWYFIYPVDKNTDEIYPRSIKTIIYMLSFCFSIVVTASVAFLWNKKHCAKEVDGVNDINMVPSVDIELETLPGKSLAHVTNVHYGVKPDLAKILSDCGGSSVGVYVCGPKRLQSDVASICSSDSTGNRHFEFISFSW
ncbi:unnamed protein product [Rhodiola kirilowii]